MMSHGSGGPNPFIQVLEEFALAVFVLALHGVLAVVAILIGTGVHKVLEYFTDPEKHTPEIGGVSVRYIIEGGEIMLVAVVLGMGVLSALALFGVRLVKHLKG